jgi:DNA-binding response OmpR family regulator
MKLSSLPRAKAVDSPTANAEVTANMNRSATFQRDAPLRVLVLTDDKAVGEVINLTLSHASYITRTAGSVAEALTVLDEWQPQIAIVNVELAGDHLMERISAAGRAAAPPLPVLALTRRGDLKTKLAAFEHGVDDIMTVPFSPEELLARVLVVTRRIYGQTVPLTPVIKIGELEIDILNRHVKAGSSQLHLTSVEQSLLYLLAANAGQLLTRNEIMDALWGVDYVAESNVVDRHIRNLRAKLQNDWRKPRFIETVPGRGYRFVGTFSETEESFDLRPTSPASQSPPSTGSAGSARSK